MNAKATWAMLALAGGLFSFIWWVERPLRGERQRVQSRQLLPGLRPGSITSLTLRPQGQGEIRAERNNTNGWGLSRPLLYPAQPAPIEALVKGLETLHWQAHITASELRHKPNAESEFGFDAPQASLVIQEGDQRRHLLFGAKTAVGDQVFVQVVGGEGFYLIDSQFLNLLPHRPDEWRDTVVVPYNLQKTDLLKVRLAGKSSFDLQHDGTNAQWQLQKPITARASGAKIEALLQQLQGLRVSRFESDDPQADLDLYGLQPAELELQFLDLSGAATNQLITLQVGRSPTNNPALVYVRRNGTNLFLVPRDPLLAWRGSPVEFRERHLFAPLTNRIDVVEIVGEDKFSLHRQPDDSWMVQPQGFPADTELTQLLLNRLKKMEVEFEKPVVTDFSSYGLAQPLLQYTMKEQPGPAQVLAQFHFGTNGTGKIFSHRTDEESVNSVAASDFNYLPRTSWQMRDRQVWRFATTNVVGLAIHQKGLTRRLMRDAAGEWQPTPGFPSKAVINPFSLEEFLYRLGTLRAIFWNARGEKNLERFGFKETDHRIELQVKRGTTLETLSLSFGNHSEYMHPYALVELNGEEVVFEFPAPVYYQFVQPDLTIPEAQGR